MGVFRDTFLGWIITKLQTCYEALACVCEFFLYHLWIVVQHHVSLHSQIRPVFSPYSITELFSCTLSLFELRFPCTGLLFQDINSHRTMFQCYDCLEVLTVTGLCLKVTGQTFKGLPFTGHVFMYSADFPRRVFGGCTVHEHRSVFLYYKTMLELWFPRTG